MYFQINAYTGQMNWYKMNMFENQNVKNPFNIPQNLMGKEYNFVQKRKMATKNIEKALPREGFREAPSQNEKTL